MSLEKTTFVFEESQQFTVLAKTACEKTKTIKIRGGARILLRELIACAIVVLSERNAMSLRKKIIPFLVFYTHLRLIDPSFFLSFS